MDHATIADKRKTTAAAGTQGWRFPALLLLALALLLVFTRPYVGGDVVEYATDAVAIGAHGKPDIRLDDIARAKALDPRLAGTLDLLEHGMRAGEREVYAAFVRGRHDAVYSVHFFGYSLLAAAPMKLLARLGLPPMRAFQVVNYLAVFVLGLALRRFFGSAGRAWLGLGLFLGCGGALYLNWTSPECVSAACLLAALLLYLSAAPLAAGILAGLASQQNPTIVFFFAFAPLLKLWLDRRPGQRLVDAARTQLDRAHLAGLAAGLFLFALPLLFNLVHYGVPNIIARKFSDPGLVSATRLVSFFLDLNQGMILGIPGLLAALLLWDHSRRAFGTLALCLLFTLALVLPALAVLNWNSGAVGIMRYAFWSAMPLLLALHLRLRARAAWPRAWIVGVAIVQVAAMAHAASYPYVRFSPLATLVLENAPQWYHPEPEIFVERAGNNDDYIRADRAYSFGTGAARKTLYTPGNAQALQELCGPGATVAPDNRTVDSAHGWRYIDGDVRCVVAGGSLRQYWSPLQFARNSGLALASGWSNVEDAGPEWRGVWSNGARSRLVLTLPASWRPDGVVLRGEYFDGNSRTRVRIDGVDLGWQQLDHAPLLPLPRTAAGAVVTIELEHENPHAPNQSDARQLAVFLHDVALYQAQSAAHDHR